MDNNGTVVDGSVVGQSNQPEAPTQHRFMAAISYVNFLCIIPLLFSKGDAFVKYHAKQGFVLAMIGGLISGANYVLGNMYLSPGRAFGLTAVEVLSFILLFVQIIGFIKAFKGEKYHLPRISELAEKYNF